MGTLALVPTQGEGRPFRLLRAGCAIFWIVHLLYLALMGAGCRRPQLVEALDEVVEEDLWVDRGLAGF